MACLKEYKCKCGYKIAASPKGHDYLMMGEFYHFLCKKCRVAIGAEFIKPSAAYSGKGAGGLEVLND